MNLVKAIVKLVLKKAFNKQSAFGRLDLDIREKFRFSCRFSFLGKSLLVVSIVCCTLEASATIADGLKTNSCLERPMRMVSKLIPVPRVPIGFDFHCSR
jgi:hypothetical protein